MKINLYKKYDSYNVGEFYLQKDNWDDWDFKTTFYLYFFSSEKAFEKIGEVKIAKRNQVSGFDIGTTVVPDSFEKLDEDYFSLGQGKIYYENLNNYGDEIRDFVLNALNDIAFDEEVFRNVLDENVTNVSLLRDWSVEMVRGGLRRLATGDAELSDYNFLYNFPNTNKNKKLTSSIDFRVVPYVSPPTNIHVLIGRNGVGKTYVLNNMIDSLVNNSKPNSKYGYFSSPSFEGEIFNNLVSVSFSAFDDREPPNERKDSAKGIKYSYIGLKRPKSDKNSAPKSTTILKNEFLKSIENSIKGAKWRRLKSALITLSSDPVFRRLGLIEVIESYNFDRIEVDINKKIGELFRRLSSGHRIVLLTMVRLVETVDERSLVLLDEPETHLHPPLLSAFIRALSNLLIKRNAVALIATHSPVVLQEVPKSCVWNLNRSGSFSKAERLTFESFGENVGGLTNEVFGLEVTDSGFHKLISDVVNESRTIDEVFYKFNNELGLEAKAIVRALFNLKNRGHAKTW